MTNLRKMLPNLFSSKFQEVIPGLRQLVSKRGANWESRFFSEVRIQSISHGSKLIERVFEDPAVNHEIDSIVKSKGGIKGSLVWDLYFAIYDRLVAYSDGYLALLKQADIWLPPDGVLMDCGAGTGNFSASLVKASPQRTMAVIDPSPKGLALARAKFSLIKVLGNRSKFYRLNLTEGLPKLSKKAAGAVMNNVLYSLPEPQRLKVLQEVLSKLEPGGSLFLCDPLPALENSASALRKFLTAITVDAHLNGSPMTELDLAFFVYLNRQLVRQFGKSFLSERALSDLALSAGFQIVGRKLGYYECATLLHLRRPIEILAHRRGK